MNPHASAKKKTKAQWYDFNDRALFKLPQEYLAHILHNIAKTSFLLFPLLSVSTWFVLLCTFRVCYIFFFLIPLFHCFSSEKVAWIHIDRQMILTIHRHVISKIPRYSISYDNANTWQLHVNQAQQDDRGYYMCQVKRKLFYLPETPDEHTTHIHMCIICI